MCLSSPLHSQHTLLLSSSFLPLSLPPSLSLLRPDCRNTKRSARLGKESHCQTHQGQSLWQQTIFFHFQISLANKHSNNTQAMECTQANPYAKPTHTTNIILCDPYFMMSYLPTCRWTVASNLLDLECFCLKMLRVHSSIDRHDASQVSTKKEGLGIFWWDKQYFCLIIKQKAGWLVGMWCVCVCGCVSGTRIV